ncbi:MAG: hypothetical protein WDZ40_03075 [Candidatus Spechtbacterales bacterium]
MIKYLLLGFFIQFITSLDDTLTRIPISANLTRRRKGKIAFSLGNVLAVATAVTIAYFFSAFLDKLLYTRYVVSGLILLLAAVVYFDVFKGRISKKADYKLRRPMSTERFLRLMGAGFVISFIMTIDDIVALAPLFIDTTFLEKIFALAGVSAATAVLIFFVIYSSERLKKIPHKKDIAAGSLLLLSLLVLMGIV